MKSLFDLPPRRATNSTDAILVSKAKKSKKTPTTVKGGGGIATQIANIKAQVLKALGKYEDETLIIRDEDVLDDYITKAIAYGEIAIDTETTGLDPLLDECVGVGLCVPNEKTAYIPMNHISYITMEKIPNQLSKEVVAKQLKRLLGDCIPYAKKVKVIMFNAVFDIRVLKNQVGVVLHCEWDCSLASRLLNENELKGQNGLKALHQKYVLNGVGDAFAFDALFKGIKFSLIPINVAALYAAHDPKITWELYDFQRQYLYYDQTCTFEDRDGLNGVSWAFFNIEMPVVDVVVAMEDIGVALDLDYTRKLSDKYNQLLEEKKNAFYDICSEYSDVIDAWRAENPNAKLDDPINISSPTQLTILLYDIIGLDAGIDRRTKKPIRGTGEEVLSKIPHPLCDAILDYRGVEKLVSTYIDKLPTCLNPNDHRVHGKFNSYGADTGRFSSSDPNLQNIPSHNKDIRPMFKATEYEYTVDSLDDSFVVPKWCEVETSKGFIYASAIQVGDSLLCENVEILVVKIETLIDSNQIKLYY